MTCFLIFYNVSLLTGWALKMFDASAKLLPSGITQVSNINCPLNKLRVRSTNEKTSGGFFPFRETWYTSLEAFPPVLKWRLLTSRANTVTWLSRAKAWSGQAFEVYRLHGKNFMTSHFSIQSRSFIGWKKIMIPMVESWLDSYWTTLFCE